MLIHADFSKIAVIKPEDYCWIHSPRGEVKRVMFDRIGTEQARATSLVKFDKNSRFPAHQHPLGEEVLVLSGIFTENDTNDFPAGWYLRNPHNSHHQVSSKDGALIFVKLMQMSKHEVKETRINTDDPANWILINRKVICPLFESEFEYTYLERLNPNQIFTNISDQGIEIFIVSGQLKQSNQIYPTGTWIRLPPKRHADFQVCERNTTLYVKTKHLLHAQQIWNSKND